MDPHLFSEKLLLRRKNQPMYLHVWPFQQSSLDDDKLLKIGKDWNLYREFYNDLSFEDLKKLNTFWYSMGSCLHFDAPFVKSCLRYLTKRLGRKDLFVAEMGGAQGELAYEILKNFPEITYRNYDIIPFWRVRELSQYNYEQIVLTKHLWLEKIDLKGCDVFIMSDVIEHFTDEEAIKILNMLNALNVKSIIIKSPLSPDGETWDNYFGSHLLRMGSNQLISILGRDYQLKRKYYDCYFWIRR